MRLYDGVLKGISENEVPPRGKSVSENSFKSKQTGWQLGLPEWQTKLETTNQYLHGPKTRVLNDYKREVFNASHFKIEGEKPSATQKEVFQTENLKSFVNFPGATKTKPALNTNEIYKTTFILGEDQSKILATSHIQHNDKSREKIPDIRWKNNLHKYDIITNHDKNQEKLNKVCGYEYWQSHLDKKRSSNNKSDFSNRLQRMDILNGRPMRSHKKL